MMKAKMRKSEGRRKWRAAALLAMLCAWEIASGAVAQTTRESDVEAAYLFNFAKFMHEPAHSPDSFTIAVVGTSPIGQMLETITANEQVDGRPLKVVHAATVDQARNSDMVFLSEAETPRIDKDLAALAGSNSLTVSSANDFVKRGGMIQFLVVNNRVRFLVNLNATSKAKITLSSELLKVAMGVTGSPSTEAQP
jgi:hypothetical protein